MSTQLDQIAKKAKSNPKLRFTSLAHLLTPEFLAETWKQMNRRGASGVDGETTKEFEQGLDTRVQELCERLKRGAYRAPPVRRVAIPKGPGKAGTRPLGIPTVEDRLLQRAVARILEAVFEADFLECSYGFRPGCNPHGALRALRGIIVTKKVGHLFEADIRGYFNHIQHEWLQKMVAHRIADPFILRLIGKWLNAGFMVGGVVTRTEEGSPQGGPNTPLTQKVISSSSEQLRDGELDTRCLIFALRGNIVMSYGTLDQNGKGSTLEHRSWSAPASSCASRSGAAVVRQVQFVRASSISLPGGSLSAGSSRRSSRGHSADHDEASAAYGGTSPEVREKQRTDHWSHRDRRIECVSAHSKKAWLSRIQKAAHFKSTFPIRLIVCSSRSSHRPTTFWCPVASVLWACT
jgi:retron-type reverse transcriptase